MPTLDASLLIGLLKDTPSVTVAEACLQQAIRSINLEGLSYDDVRLKTLTGTPLSGTYTDMEIAGILQVAISVYSVNYKNSGASNSSGSNVNLNGVLSWGENSSSSVSSSSNNASVVSAVALQVAAKLHKVESTNYRRAIV